MYIVQPELQFELSLFRFEFCANERTHDDMNRAVAKHNIEL